MADIATVAAVIGGAAAGGAVAILGVPAVIGAIGFGTAGIAKGSLAASMMALNGEATAAGSVVAVCQSIGAAGVSIAFGVVSGVAGGAAVLLS